MGDASRSLVPGRAGRVNRTAVVVHFWFVAQHETALQREMVVASLRGGGFFLVASLRGGERVIAQLSRSLPFGADPLDFPGLSREKKRKKKKKKKKKKKGKKKKKKKKKK